MYFCQALLCNSGYVYLLYKPDSFILHHYLLFMLPTSIHFIHISIKSFILAFNILRICLQNYIFSVVIRHLFSVGNLGGGEVGGVPNFITIFLSVVHKQFLTFILYVVFFLLHLEITVMIHIYSLHWGCLYVDWSYYLHANKKFL